ncbi:MAG: pantoate--beta-alanine ligase [Candidatus Omnitrophica bacterium]|nr:pantoate--beta-alanine ligase [Candidatus Omnitrophota bacterium]
MKCVITRGALQRQLRRFRTRGESIGFVPTMGDLHVGHLSLIHRARRENDRVVVSIFVNPKQFGPNEDYRRYPRNLKRDARLCRRAKVDIIFTPAAAQIYPADFQTSVDVERFGKLLCGKDRPGHFKGVATVVAKLFHWVVPDRAYFGLKDYQQAVIIRQMARDLGFSVGLRFCPLVREGDGLAASSRNRYLSVEERKRALALYSALKRGRELIRRGTREAALVERKLRNYLSRFVDRIHYVTVVDPDSLENVRRIRGSVLIAVAVRVGKTRLIDNLKVSVH